MALLERVRIAVFVPDLPVTHNGNLLLSLEEEFIYAPGRGAILRNRIRSVIACICIILTSVIYSQAKEWRGITPLRSTLRDVQRQFGRCTTATNTSCTYAWEKETVTFVVLLESCGVGKARLPRQTVMHIERRPKTVTRMSDYHKIDFNHYSAFYAEVDTRFENYINDEEGFAAEAEDGVVTQVHYVARADEAGLCPGSYVSLSGLLPRHEPKMLLEFFCPTVVVSCPTVTIEVDESITFQGSHSSGFPYMEPTYTWSVSAGRIVHGQNTPSIRVDTKGIADGTEITATLTVGGAPASCSSMASCTTRLQPYRIRVK